MFTGMFITASSRFSLASVFLIMCLKEMITPKEDFLRCLSPVLAQHEDSGDVDLPLRGVVHH